MISATDKKSFLKRLGIVSLSAFLLACASYPVENLPAEIPRQAMIYGLPHYPQTEDQCGPASLATLVAQRDIEITPEQIKPGVYIPGKGGTLAIELKAQSRRFELLPYEIAPNMSSLLAEIAAGNAVLVMQNLGLSWAPQWHFAVAIGYDLNLGEIYLRSGPHQAEAFNLALFDRTWARAQRWAILALKPDQIPASATLPRYFSAVNSLEQAGFLDAAKTGYETAVSHWPEESLAQFGLANIHYLQGEYLLALQHYQNSVSLQPNHPDYWNNMAYSLVQLQCFEQAVTSVQCAVSQSPESDNLLDSQTEIISISRLADTENMSCPTLPLCP